MLLHGYAEIGNYFQIISDYFVGHLNISYVYAVHIMLSDELKGYFWLDIYTR